MANERNQARLLVVEDDARSRALLVDILVNTGYQVNEAADGARALRELRRRNSRVDLVLLDMQMPKVDGFTVAREIRSDPLLHSLPIIAITAMDRPDDAFETLRAGCDAYLAKPIAIADVREMVAGLLADRAQATAFGTAPTAEAAEHGRTSDAEQLRRTLLASILDLARLLERATEVGPRERAYARELREASVDLAALLDRR